MKKGKKKKTRHKTLNIHFFFLHDTSGHDNHNVLSQILVTVFSDKILIQYEKHFGIFSVHSVT